LQGYGLSIADVQQAILSSNLDFPTGSLKPELQNLPSDYQEI
jgi:multidrug efflux pump subunit AcrB